MGIRCNTEAVPAAVSFAIDLVSVCHWNKLREGEIKMKQAGRPASIII